MMLVSVNSVIKMTVLVGIISYPLLTLWKQFGTVLEWP